jgi:8-oxo-dGTP pyrophosphatase MutT (NUDIX family)
MRLILPRLAHPLSRKQMPAHFTASALLVDIASGRVALLRHARLDNWLQPGGHAEAIDKGLMHHAAVREANEETGCAVRLYHDPPTLLDVDVHLIPARADDPAHHHLDLRFLVVAQDPQALALNAAESFAVHWLSFDAAMWRAADPPLRRMIRKARSILSR